jgi:hypothetical protein
MKVSFKNNAGLVRSIPVGLSFTALFFGPLPLFFRGLYGKGFLWMFLLFVTCGLSNLILVLRLNRITAHAYLEKGYKPYGDNWHEAGESWGVVYDG